MSETDMPAAPAADQQAPAVEDAAPIVLPDDHPLVKSFAALKESNKSLKDQLKVAAPQAQRLAELEEASKTEQEKAVSTAVAAARAELLGDVGKRLAAAKAEAALTGVVPDPAAIVADLNLSAFVDSEGEVDVDAIAALRKKYQEFAAKPGTPDLKQGQQGIPPSLDSRIADAESRGDMKAVLALQAEKVASQFQK